MYMLYHIQYRHYIIHVTFYHHCLTYKRLPKKCRMITSNKCTHFIPAIICDSLQCSVGLGGQSSESSNHKAYVYNWPGVYVIRNVLNIFQRVGDTWKPRNKEYFEYISKGDTWELPRIRPYWNVFCSFVASHICHIK